MVLCFKGKIGGKMYATIVKNITHALNNGATGRRWILLGEPEKKKHGKHFPIWAKLLLDGKYFSY